VWNSGDPWQDRTLEGLFTISFLLRFVDLPLLGLRLEKLLHDWE
jgi:hypothetical protein